MCGRVSPLGSWINCVGRRGTICVAHNFKAYDSYFVLEAFYKEDRCPDQIVNGGKILSMTVDDLTFIDSINFLPMALSAFPKAFGLTELRKGFFSHFFNTEEKKWYVGAIPAVDYYDPESFSPERREEFLRWHADRRQENYEFDFQHELVEYCKSDMRLLKEETRKKQVTHYCRPRGWCLSVSLAFFVFHFEFTDTPIGKNADPPPHTHAVGGRPCCPQPTATTCVVWSWRLKECLCTRLGSKRLGL